MVSVATKKTIFTKKITPILDNTIDEINRYYSNLEDYINYYLSLLKEKGFTMMELKLDKVTSTLDVIDVVNKNNQTITNYLMYLNTMFSENVIAASSTETITNISFMSQEMKGAINIGNTNIKVQIEGYDDVNIDSVSKNITYKEESISL